MTFPSPRVCHKSPTDWAMQTCHIVSGLYMTGPLLYFAAISIISGHKIVFKFQNAYKSSENSIDTNVYDIW